MNGSTEDIHTLPHRPSPHTSLTSHNYSSETQLLTPQLVCTFCQLIFVFVNIVTDEKGQHTVYAEASLERGFFFLFFFI